MSFSTFRNTAISGSAVETSSGYSDSLESVSKETTDPVTTQIKKNIEEKNEPVPVTPRPKRHVIDKPGPKQISDPVMKLKKSAPDPQPKKKTVTRKEERDKGFEIAGFNGYVVLIVSTALIIFGFNNWG